MIYEKIESLGVKKEIVEKLKEFCTNGEHWQVLIFVEDKPFFKMWETPMPLCTFHFIVIYNDKEIEENDLNEKFEEILEDFVGEKVAIDFATYYETEKDFHNWFFEE